MDHSKKLMTLCCALGLLFPITAHAEMSYLQGIMIIARQVMTEKCPKHFALTDPAKHREELAYVKSQLPPSAKENSYTALRAKMLKGYQSPGACDVEARKVKANPGMPYSPPEMKVLK